MNNAYTPLGEGKNDSKRKRLMWICIIFSLTRIYLKFKKKMRQYDLSTDLLSISNRLFEVENHFQTLTFGVESTSVEKPARKIKNFGYYQWLCDNQKKSCQKYSRKTVWKTKFIYTEYNNICSHLHALFIIYFRNKLSKCAMSSSRGAIYSFRDDENEDGVGKSSILYFL